MSHVYKHVARKKPKPLSFVKLVKEYGDHWQSQLPYNVKQIHEINGPDMGDAIQMLCMEQGLFPRIKDVDL